MPRDAPEIKLRIESDGLIHNTRIFDEEGRELICRSVQWRVEGGRKAEGVAVVTLEVYDVPVQVKRRKEDKV